MDMGRIPAGIIRSMLSRAARFVFLTNSAYWFERDLTVPIQPSVSAIPVDVCFDSERTIRWIREHGERWMYNSREIDVARRENHLFACARRGDAVVGFVKAGIGRVYVEDYRRELTLEPKQVFFYDVYVLPAYRGQDIAPYLTRQVMRRLKERGFKKAKLHIPPWNKASLRAAGKNGFRKVSYVRFVRILGLTFFVQHD